MSFIDSHLRAASLALSRIIKEPVGSIATVLVIALALSIPATLYRVADLTRTLVQDDAHRPQILLVLKDGLREDQVKTLKESLTARHDLRQVQSVTPDQGLKALQQRLGRDDLLAGLEGNPLPTVISVQPIDLQADHLKTLSETLKSLPGVDHLRLDADWAKRLHALGHFVDQGVTLLGLVLLIAVLTVVSNTIRLQLSLASDEIEVCKLMGASDSFVRRPFLYFGAIEMTLGTGLALGLGELARAGFNRLSSEWLAPLGFQFSLSALSTPEMAIALIGAALLGAVVSSLTVTGTLLRLR